MYPVAKFRAAKSEHQGSLPPVQFALHLEQQSIKLDIALVFRIKLYLLLLLL